MQRERERERETRVDVVRPLFDVARRVNACVERDDDRRERGRRTNVCGLNFVPLTSQQSVGERRE